MGSTTDWVEDRELIAVLSKVGGIDSGWDWPGREA